MTEWITKKEFKFPVELVPHINWESFAPYVDIYGRLVIEKNFATGAIIVLAQAPAEGAMMVPNPVSELISQCTCEMCQTVRAKEQAQLERQHENHLP